MSQEFKAKVVVNSFQESEYAKDVIKSKLVKYSESSKDTFQGGLVAVNKDGDLYNETNSEEIREYRYSGPTVNNYVTFNDEMWRIIGVFKDEIGVEHLKIVRNEPLKGDMMPLTYTAVNGIEYNVRYNSSSDTAYWNYPTSDTINNDWTTGGLQYWLNAGNDKETKQPRDGYMSYLSQNAKSMLEETKYYLGNFGYNKDTITNYTYERGNTSCSESCSGGDVWKGNQATWTGKIGLMYPSDYGYTTNRCNWSTIVYIYNENVNTSWLKTTANHSSDEWLLSPSYTLSSSSARWYAAGTLNNRGVNGFLGVRPSLNLKSQVKITSGDGSSESPYFLEI